MLQVILEKVACKASSSEDGEMRNVQEWESGG
jgi:hypothetical protein